MVLNFPLKLVAYTWDVELMACLNSTVWNSVVCYRVEDPFQDACQLEINKLRGLYYVKWLRALAFVIEYKVKT